MTEQLPLWLEAKIDQRMAQLRFAAAASAFLGYSVIMTSLTEPVEDSKVSLDFWERACDNCAAYTPEGRDFYTGTLQQVLPDGRPVFLSFGVCADCYATIPDSMKGPAT